MQLVLIAAQSLDGFITRGATPGTAWASSADQTWFRRALREFEASIMGRTTYETVREELRGHLSADHPRIVMTRRPVHFRHEAMAGQLEFSDSSPQAVLAELTAQGRQRVALLGGAQIHDLFLAAGLVDELWVTVEPRLFGRGTPLVDSAMDVHLTLRDWERLPDSDSLLVRYRIEP